MANPVPGPREHRSIFRRHALQEEVILRVLVVELDHVVIDVLHDERHLHAVLAELFELHPRHRPGGILQEHLIDAVADDLPRGQRATDEVLPQDLLDDVVVVRHSVSPSSCSARAPIRCATEPRQ